MEVGGTFCSLWFREIWGCDGCSGYCWDAIGEEAIAGSGIVPVFDSLISVLVVGNTHVFPVGSIAGGSVSGLLCPFDEVSVHYVLVMVVSAGVISPSCFISPYFEGFGNLFQSGFVSTGSRCILPCSAISTEGDTPSLWFRRVR